MCTFDLSFNNALVDSIRPAFKDDNAIKEWMQHQLELLMAQLKVSQTNPQNASYHHSLSHLRGIGTTGQSIEQIRDEYYKEKYGV